MSPRQLSPGQSFITTAPGLIECPKCHRTVLAATVGGFDIHIDPTALTPTGELQALLAGVATFDLRGETLIRRTPIRIRRGEPGTVLPAHTCHPIPDQYVNGAHMAAAVWLVQNLLGATPVLPDNPPY